MMSWCTYFITEHLQAGHRLDILTELHEWNSIQMQPFYADWVVYMEHFHSFWTFGFILIGIRGSSKTQLERSWTSLIQKQLDIVEYIATWCQQLRHCYELNKTGKNKLSILSLKTVIRKKTLLVVLSGVFHMVYVCFTGESNVPDKIKCFWLSWTIRLKSLSYQLISIYVKYEVLKAEFILKYNINQK